MTKEHTVLTDAARRRALRGLLAYTFFMVGGFALLMPLVAIHFVNELGLAAAAVGAALALRQLLQQGLAVFGGALADRYGLRRLIAAGVLLRAAGFAGLAFAGDIATLTAGLAVAALGGALFEAPYQAAIAALATPETRPRYYAASNWISGVASTLGPLLGVWLLRLDFAWVCAVAAGCFALNFLVVLLILPRIAAPERAPSAAGGFALVLADRRFLHFVALMTGYWFVAMQITISFPLLAERLTGSVDSVGVLFALSAAITVALQYSLVNFLTRWLEPPAMLLCGIATLTAGAAIVAFAAHFAVFLGGIAIFALGAVLTRPSQQTLIAELAHPQALATFLGVSSLSLAIGGGIGNIVGGWLVEPAQWSRWPWLAGSLFLLIGLGTCAALLRFNRAARAPQRLDADGAGAS